jgi:3-methyladenine DNA glycosylase AlkD
MMARANATTFFRSRFRQLGKVDRAKWEKAYMNSDLDFHGVASDDIVAVCIAFCERYEIDHDALKATVDQLFATRYFDVRSAGCYLLERKRKLLVPSDLPWIVDLVRIARCWAHVDHLATRVIGDLVAKHDASKLIRKWARDRDFWVRRTALLAQLRQLRRGAGDFALFEEIAVPMLSEKEFFIRKAIGWVLREVSKKRPQLVHAFLAKHLAHVSGLTLREAAKYLSAAQRAELTPPLRGRALRDG